jgi:metal-responsive CopG/Arc/MetJ family transcriptional regulator
MKKKIGIRIEEDLIRQANRLAIKESRSLSDVIQKALVFYLKTETPDPIKRLKAYKLFCERPMRISKNQLKKIMEADTCSE